MISDPMWKESLLNGEIIEESNYGYYKTKLIKSNRPTGHLYYPYRIFFFEEDINEPSFAVNLENSGFSEELVLGVHGYIKHYNYGTVDNNISVAEFKSKALSLAEKHIGPPTKNKVEGKRSEKEMLQEIDELFSDDNDEVTLEKELLDSFPDELIPNRRYIPIILGIFAFVGVLFFTFKLPNLNFWIKNITAFLLFVFSFGSLRIAIFSSKREIFDLTTTTKSKLELKQAIFNEQLKKLRTPPKGAETG